MKDLLDLVDMERIQQAEQSKQKKKKKKETEKGSSFGWCCGLSKKEQEVSEHFNEEVTLHLEQFHEEISAIQTLKEDLLSNIHQLTERSIVTPRSMCLHSIAKKAEVFKEKMISLRDSNESLLDQGYEKGSAVDRIRTTLTESLKIQPEVLMSLNQLRDTILAERMEHLKKLRLYATGGNPREETPSISKGNHQVGSCAKSCYSSDSTAGETTLSTETVDENLMISRHLSELDQLQKISSDLEETTLSTETVDENLMISRHLSELDHLQKISSDLELHLIKLQLELTVDEDSIENYVGKQD